MIEITFNAFSFLQPKLKRNNMAYADATMTLPAGITVSELILELGLERGDVEGAFVNNRIVAMDTILADRDRVALVPPGTPGPYRVMLGIVKMKKSEGGKPHAKAAE